MTEGASGLGELLRLRTGVYTVTTPQKELHLVCWPYTLPLGSPAPGLRAVIDKLAQGPCTPAALAELWRDSPTGGAGESLDELLHRLRAGGWLIRVVTRDGRPLYTVYPLGEPPPAPASLPSGAVLSRFALLRREGSELLLESPRAGSELHVHEPSLLTVLASPGSEASSSGGTASDSAQDWFREDLHRWGFLAPEAHAEEAGLREAQWSPHELWFHARSRIGPHYASALLGPPQFGWALGRFEPLPPRRPPFPEPAIPLVRPDLDRLRGTDATLTAVLESRRSLRVHDDTQPLTLEQLGEFLYRCAAVRATIQIQGQEFSSRPYPAGGALYELEFYLAVRHVAGLPPGLYHHDPFSHELRRVPGPVGPTRRLLLQASRSAGTPEPPQVLVLLAARFSRLMWKYQAFAYALSLKHVGVVFQVMYSVATAMGLAPCALGTGDSESFALATGADPLEESTLGEFMLGSRRPEEAGSGKP